MDTEVGFQPQLYQRRWVILGALTLLQVMQAVSYVSFGQVNDFFTHFFNITNREVDWISLSHYVAPFLMAAPLVWIIHVKNIGFRKLVITSGICLTLTQLSTVASLLYDKFFVVVLVGHLISGVSGTILLTTPSIFAVLWFPEEQVGTAIGVNTMGVYLGGSIGAILPSLAVSNQTQFANRTVFDEEEPIQDVRTHLFVLIVNCVFFILVLSVTSFLVCYASDRPTTPPTRAQALKKEAKVESKDWSSFTKILKRLVCDKTFVCTCVGFSVVSQIGTIGFIMMSQIVREMSSAHHLGLKNPDLIGGYVMGAYSAGGAIGSLVSGKLVDIYKMYSKISTAGCAVTSTAFVLIFVSFIEGDIFMYFVSNFCAGVGSKIVMVVLFEIATQHTYPTDETFVTTWMISIISPMGMIVGSIGRWLFNHHGGIGVLAFTTSLMVCASLLIATLSPKNARLAVRYEEEKPCAPNESTPLLQQL